MWLAAALAGLLSGFEDSEASTCGFLLPLTTLPTVEAVPERTLGAAALALRISRRSFVSSSLLDEPPCRLPEGRMCDIEFSSLTLRRGGAAVGSDGCVGGFCDCCRA